MQGNFQEDETGIHLQLKVLASVLKLLDPTLHDYFERYDWWYGW